MVHDRMPHRGLPGLRSSVLLRSTLHIDGANHIQPESTFNCQTCQRTPPLFWQQVVNCLICGSTTHKPETGFSVPTCTLHSQVELTRSMDSRPSPLPSTRSGTLLGHAHPRGSTVTTLCVSNAWTSSIWHRSPRGHTELITWVVCDLVSTS